MIGWIVVVHTYSKGVGMDEDDFNELHRLKRKMIQKSSYHLYIL